MRAAVRVHSSFAAWSIISRARRRTAGRSASWEALGPQRLGRIVELADVYHSDNIVPAASDRFIEEAGIGEGVFDNVAAARYAVPSHWDIGKVYKRLAALAIADREGTTDVGAILRAYRSPAQRSHRQLQRQFLLRFARGHLRCLRHGRAGVAVLRLSPGMQYFA